MFTYSEVFVLGLVFGAAGALFVLVWLRLKNDSAGESRTRDKGFILYLNFLLMNKEEVVYERVKGRIGSRFGGEGPLSRAVASWASRRVTDEKVVGRIVERIVERTPERLKEKGIDGACRLVFCDKSYFVIELHITKCDSERLLLQSHGGRKLSTLMSMVNSPTIEDTVSGRVLLRLKTQLQAILPERLEKVFLDNGVEIDIIVKQSDHQAKHMYQILEGFRAGNFSKDK
jgi:hypothetical protein